MSTLARAQELATGLTEVLAPAGVQVVSDIRNAAAPCVVIGPPTMRGDVPGGVTCEWRLLLLLPGTRWDPDVWTLADRVLALLHPVLPIDRADPLDAANDETPMPALRITFEEGITL